MAETTDSIRTVVLGKECIPQMTTDQTLLEISEHHTLVKGYKTCQLDNMRKIQGT